MILKNSIFLEIHQVDCSQDANLEALEIENATETDLKVKRTPYPAVLRFNIAKIRKTGWNSLGLNFIIVPINCNEYLENYCPSGGNF